MLAALAVFATLTVLAILAIAAVAAVTVPVAAIVVAVVALVIVAPVVVAAVFLVVGEFRRRTFDHGLRPGAIRRGRGLGAGVADGIELVTIFIEIFVEVVAVLLGILDRHLRLRGGDDAIVVFRMLEIILRHHPVAGALRVTGERSVFFGDLLCRSADLHIRAIALVGAGEGIGPLTVVIVATAAAIVVATAHAPVLLLWPH
jgi:hypothetical protein